MENKEKKIAELMGTLPEKLAERLAPLLSTGKVPDVLPVLKDLQTKLGVLIKKLEESNDTSADSR